jgi:hypothetical protein
MVKEPEATRLHNLAVTLALTAIFEYKLILDDDTVEHLGLCFMEALKHLQQVHS